MKVFNVTIDVDGVKVPFKINAVTEKDANSRANSLFKILDRNTCSNIRIDTVEDPTPLREIGDKDLLETIECTETGLALKMKVVSTYEDRIKSLAAHLKDAKMIVTTEPVAYALNFGKRVKAVLLTTTIPLKHDTTVAYINTMVTYTTGLITAIGGDCSEKTIKEAFINLTTLYRKTRGLDVVLKSVGPTKLQVVKAIKEALNLGLIEAKDLVDGAPCAVKKGVNVATAKTIKAALEAAGAEVEIK